LASCMRSARWRQAEQPRLAPPTEEVMNLHPTLEKRMLARTLSVQISDIQKTIEVELPELAAGEVIGELDGVRGTLESFSHGPDSKLHMVAFALHEALKSGDVAQITKVAHHLNQLFAELF